MWLTRYCWVVCYVRLVTILYYHKLFYGGAATESLTEVGQQMLERSQAGLPIDSEDAIAEYREAAIAGGLIGGGTRATFGAFQGTPGKDDATTDAIKTTPDETEVDADTDTDTVEQQATAAIATDPRLTDPNLDEDFIREELAAEYSPEVIGAIIVRNA